MEKINKYRVEIPTRSVEIYEIKSDTPLTLAEIMSRVSKKPPDDVDFLNTGDEKEIFVLTGKIHEN
jgi:hypothetical protein|tara:strand:+ start:2043 stop:2240 length:198 start_codon:yes stop_codon:yes gene_type:complete